MSAASRWAVASAEQREQSGESEAQGSRAKPEPCSSSGAVRIHDLKQGKIAAAVTPAALRCECTRRLDRLNMRFRPRQAPIGEPAGNGAGWRLIAATPLRPVYSRVRPWSKPNISAPQGMWRRPPERPEGRSGEPTTRQRHDDPFPADSFFERIQQFSWFFQPFADYAKIINACNVWSRSVPSRHI